MSIARPEGSTDPGIDLEGRAAPRRELRLWAFCQWGTHEPVEAELINVSLSGALLDSVALQVVPSIRPRRGTILNVEVQLPGSSESIELVGSVVRHTETGVAIQFLRMPTELREFLDRFEQASVPLSLTPERET